MKKLVTLLIVALCYFNTAFADPFGLTMGESLENLRKKVFDMKGNEASFSSLPPYKYRTFAIGKTYSDITNSRFEYDLIVTPIHGLCSVEAITLGVSFMGKDLINLQSNEESLSVLAEIKKTLTQKYGEGKDNVKNTVWTSSWMSKLPDNLAKITLEQKKDVSVTGNDLYPISIKYDYNNQKDCENWINAKLYGSL